ncbi:Sonic hedgehog protein A [Trichinella zimbabwensis]|uniref:Sonic hedgehog protein A n=1 Tax=Trichinella zimbabwensis TaxID=268475 RepID=A0A0V1H661_9BILA|nr:Sonic hedgehog protein A [Trichinella zimbabwensis]
MLKRKAAESLEPFSFNYTSYMRTTSKTWRNVAIASVIILILAVVIMTVVIVILIQSQSQANSSDQSPTTAQPPEDDGEEIPGCFPSDALVKTRSRWKTMQELHIGDEVLDLDERGRPVYTEIFAWLRYDLLKHRFVKIITANGITLTLTPNHLIFKLIHHDCATPDNRTVKLSDYEAVLAGEIQEGDVLLQVDSSLNTAHHAVVTEIYSVRGRGAFAPATLSGTLIVDGTLVSSYTSYWFFDLIGHRFIHEIIFAPIRFFYAFLKIVVKHQPIVDAWFSPKYGGTHWYVEIWKRFRSTVS